jgi:hypothetical protein
LPLTKPLQQLAGFIYLAQELVRRMDIVVLINHSGRMNVLRNGVSTLIVARVSDGHFLKPSRCHAQGASESVNNRLRTIMDTIDLKDGSISGDELVEDYTYKAFKGAGVGGRI